MGEVDQMIPSIDGEVRSVHLHKANGITNRPVVKLYQIGIMDLEGTSQTAACFLIAATRALPLV